MILSDDEIQERIESPLNLLNRLRSAVHRHPIGSPTPFIPSIPSLPPTAESLIDNLEDKIKISSTRSKATGIMHAAMDELEKRMPEVQKPERLARIASDMSRVISNQDTKGGGGTINSQIIIYAPQVQPLDNFEIIDIVE